MRRSTLRLATLISAVPTALSAQIDVGAYALSLGSYAVESDLLGSGSTFVGRGRVMLDAASNALELDVAYEHVLTRLPSGGGFRITSPAGTASRSDWLGADWELRRTTRTEWRHRFDRVSLAYSAGPLEVSVGRQAISWATTLVLTPADPFAPFDPADPFREYRGGVDAVRVRAFPGPFSEVEAVVRPSETPFGTTVTALGRAQTSAGGWAVGGWAGVLHDEGAGAVFATGAVGSTAIRTELSLREDPSGGATLRGSFGIDRFLTPGGKDLVLLAEVQYDGFGAHEGSEVLDVAQSRPFERGEMQTLSSWTLATQSSYQLHPLVGVDATVLLSATDGSALVSGGVSWSASSYASVRLGLFTGLGDGLTSAGAIGSEYGSVPNLGYVSVSWYF